MTDKPLNQTPLFELQDVNVQFKQSGGMKHVSMKIYPGEFISLTGKTSSGKSTILRLLCGLQRPTSGKILISGEDISHYQTKNSRWLRRSMGIIPQDGGLLSTQTVLENVMLPALISENSYQEARERAILALSKCGVYDLADVRPNSLSTGQKQLVCLARAVVNRPAAILADEPISHLDETNTNILLTLLGDFANAGVTVVCSSTRQLSPDHCQSRHIDLTPFSQGVL